MGCVQENPTAPTCYSAPDGQLVNPTTGVHTQNVESYWNRVKTKFKRMKGVQESMLSSYLDEFMWRERHGRTGSTALQNLCRDIALAYPV